MKTYSNIKNQQGVVLFVGLILLLVMTLVAITAMQSTNLEVRMARNDNQKLNAFITSEGPRALSGDLLDNHIYNRGWDNSIKTILGLKVIPAANNYTMASADDAGVLSNGYCNNNSGGWNCTPVALYTQALPTAALGTTSSLKRHMEYAYSEGSGNAKLSINKMAIKLAIGTSAAMVSGYEGTGKAAAASGAHIYYDIRSVGSFNEANVITGTDYRIVIRN